jgi:aerobic carbon-monoxide dehydrogenase large subunit
MTATEAASTGHVGQVRLRKEDARLVTGQTRWTDNIDVHGLLHVAILRSPVAHARLTRVDVSAAKEQPGVVAAFSGADLADDWAAPLPTAWTVTDNLIVPDHYPVAIDTVRYAGDAVAVVVARDRYAAADALEHIDVEYDPLPVVTDMERALEDTDLVHADAGTNRCYLYEDRYGDTDGVFDTAEVVVERRYIQQRLLPTAIEPRAVVADPVAATGQLTLYSSTQVPHFVRVFACLVAGVAEQDLRVIAPDVGGGFGSKLDFYAEEALLVVLARRLGKPLKWTESRSENYLATIHGRDLIQDVAVAADRDGTVRGLRVDLKADMGAYLQLLTPSIPLLGRYMYPGIYRFQAHTFTCTGVFTNKTPTDAYRGAGRPEATFAIERLMDDLAAELGMDPIELRRRNWIPHESFPYETIAGLTYDSGNYEAATDRSLELLGYEDLRREQRERRERGDRVQLGIGTSTYTEMAGLAPSRWLGETGYVAGGWEAATVRVTPLGKVEVVTGTSPHGQGHVTTFSQIAADALGVPFEDVQVIHGDTGKVPWGLDTYGSRSLAVGGIAIVGACERVVAKARRIAAHLLEAAEDDLEFADGTFQVRGSPDVTKSIQEVAFAAFGAHSLPEGVEPNLTADNVYDPEEFSYPHGTHLCAVEVDTETGKVDIRRYVAVDDVGKVVNPQIVDGQVHGGVVQGIGQALYEEAIYDAAGNLVTGTLVDYYVPSAADLPHVVTDRTETPATGNPLGVKGVGEAGTIASTPAVVNAVVDALRHLGVDDVPMPASPQNVWRALQAAGQGPADSGRGGADQGGAA